MIWKLGLCIVVLWICLDQSQGFFDNMWEKPKFNPFQDILNDRTERPTTKTWTKNTPSADGRCPACSCGLTNPSKRIVGGNEVYKNQYPWVTMLRYEGQFYCGASLISDKYVLTAAHCINGIPEDGISLRFLTHNRFNSGPETIDRLPAKITMHPDFDPVTYDNDVAIIQLNQTINFTETLRPVCLAKGSDDYSGKVGISTGWGLTSEDGNLADNLLEVKLPIISNAECESKHIYINGNMMCAGYKEGQKDSCQGDSGGPFHVVLNGNKYTQVGVISWGDGCAQPDVPGVYARVTEYYNWIRSKTRDGCFCS